MGKIPLTFCYKLPLEGRGYTKCCTHNCTLSIEIKTPDREFYWTVDDDLYCRLRI